MDGKEQNFSEYVSYILLFPNIDSQMLFGSNFQFLVLLLQERLSCNKFSGFYESLGINQHHQMSHLKAPIYFQEKDQFHISIAGC